MTRRIYYYKVVVDCGGAPCVQRGVLSLAICKPRLRGRAVAGDIVLGLAANSINAGNHVIYCRADHGGPCRRQVL
ncbi:MAG: hypothetical protein ACRET0_07105 [Steroidobacteraceae bacterium]